MTDDSDLPPRTRTAAAHIAFSSRAARPLTAAEPAPHYDPSTHEQVTFDEPLPPLVRPPSGRALRQLDHRRLPLEMIRAELLPRGRITDPRVDLEELGRSIQDVGLSNPVVVQTRSDGDGFELIEGARRLEAYRLLRDQTGDAEWREIPALVLPVEADLMSLYRRMMDENLVRRRLSPAEMARTAMTFALDPETPAETADEAIDLLFRSGSASRRRQIRAFVRLLDSIGDCLRFPDDIASNLGLALDQVLRDQPHRSYEIAALLAQWENRSIQEELSVLRHFAGVDDLDRIAESETGFKATVQRAPQALWRAIDTDAGLVHFALTGRKLELRIPVEIDPPSGESLAAALSDLVQRFL